MEAENSEHQPTEAKGLLVFLSSQSRTTLSCLFRYYPHCFQPGATGEFVFWWSEHSWTLASLSSVGTFGQLLQRKETFQPHHFSYHHLEFLMVSQSSHLVPLHVLFFLSIVQPWCTSPSTFRLFLSLLAYLYYTSSLRSHGILAKKIFHSC